MPIRRRSRFRSLAVALAGPALIAACRGSGTGEARVVVPRGASLRIAADSLARHGVIQNATVFRLYALVRRRDRSIKAGTYQFRRGISWGEVLDDLHGGKGLMRSITIPEGWSL